MESHACLHSLSAKKYRHASSSVSHRGRPEDALDLGRGIRGQLDTPISVPYPDRHAPRMKLAPFPFLSASSSSCLSSPPPRRANARQARTPTCAAAVCTPRHIMNLEVRNRGRASGGGAPVRSTAISAPRAAALRRGHITESRLVTIVPKLPA